MTALSGNLLPFKYDIKLSKRAESLNISKPIFI